MANKARKKLTEKLTKAAENRCSSGSHKPASVGSTPTPATNQEHEQKMCDDWNAQHPLGTKVIFTDYWGKKHTGTTGEPARIVYGKAVIYLKEPTLAARYELERIHPTEEVKCYFIRQEPH